MHPHSAGGAPSTPHLPSHVSQQQQMSQQQMPQQQQMSQQQQLHQQHLQRLQQQQQSGGVPAASRFRTSGDVMAVSEAYGPPRRAFAPAPLANGSLDPFPHRPQFTGVHTAAASALPRGAVINPPGVSPQAKVPPQHRHLSPMPYTTSGGNPSSSQQKLPQHMQQQQHFQVKLASQHSSATSAPQIPAPSAGYAPHVLSNLPGGAVTSFQHQQGAQLQPTQPSSSPHQTAAYIGQPMHQLQHPGIQTRQQTAQQQQQRQRQQSQQRQEQPSLTAVSPQSPQPSISEQPILAAHGVGAQQQLQQPQQQLAAVVTSNHNVKSQGTRLPIQQVSASLRESSAATLTDQRGIHTTSGKPHDSAQATLEQVVRMCQSVLSRKRYLGPVEVLKEILESGHPPSMDGFTVEVSRMSQVPATTFGALSEHLNMVLGFISRSPESVQREMLDVAFVLFVELWVALLALSDQAAKVLFRRFERIFDKSHTPYMDDMRLVLDQSQVRHAASLKWWSASPVVHLCISAMAHTALMEVLSSFPCLPSPVRRCTSLSALLATRVAFHVIARPPHRLFSKLPSQIVAGTAGGLEVLKTMQPVNFDRTANIPWGLLGSPFFDVPSPLPHAMAKALPQWFSSSGEPMLSLINGEVTIPSDANLLLPSNAENSASIAEWRSYNATVTKHWFPPPESLVSFPSVMLVRYENAAADIELACLSRGVDCEKWAVFARGPGPLELWNLSTCERSCNRQEAADDAMEYDGGTMTLPNADQPRGTLAFCCDAEVENQEQDETSGRTEPALLLALEAAATDVSFVPPTSPYASLRSRRILASCRDGSAKLFAQGEGAAGRCLASFSHGTGPMWSIDAAPVYGSFFATGSANCCAALWAFRTASRPVRFFTGHASDVETVRFWPNSLLLASGSRDKSVRLWDIRSCLAVREFRGFEGGVNKIAVSPNGRLLGAACNGVVRVWDVAGSRELHRFDISHDSEGFDNAQITGLAYAHGSRFLAISASTGILGTVDMYSGDAACKKIKLHNCVLGDMAFNDSNVLLGLALDTLCRSNAHHNLLNDTRWASSESRDLK